MKSLELIEVDRMWHAFNDPNDQPQFMISIFSQGASAVINDGKIVTMAARNKIPKALWCDQIEIQRNW